MSRTVTPGEVRVALAGELDLATAATAADEVRQAQDTAPRVLLDLSALTFIDASGLGVVMDAELRARERGERLAVLDGSRCVRRLFELTGADRALDIVDDTSAAAERHGGTGPRPA